MRVKKTRVHIISAYPPNRGRLSEYTYELVKELAKKDYEINVFSDVNKCAEYSVDGVKIFNAWKPDNPLTLIFLPFLIMSKRPEVIISNLHFAVFGKSRIVNFIGFLAIYILNLFKKIFGYKTIVILHNIPGVLHIGFFIKNSFINRLGLFVAELMALKSDISIVTLKIYKHYVLNRYGLQVHFLPHGSWMNGKNNPLDNCSQRDSILFLGYMSPAKNIEMLAEVYKTIKEKFPYIKLLLATSPHPNFPDEMKRLRVFSGINGVEYLGYVEYKDLHNIFCRTIAVVLPYSTATGSSGVFHLASGWGIPVVATDLVEFRELYYEGAGIILCRNVNDMVEALEKLINNKSYWSKLAYKNLVYAENHCWHKIANQLAEIIDNLHKPTHVKAL